MTDRTRLHRLIPRLIHRAQNNRVVTSTRLRVGHFDSGKAVNCKSTLIWLAVYVYTYVVFKVLESRKKLAAQLIVPGEFQGGAR